jgi:predicted small lipoprotein YifL
MRAGHNEVDMMNYMKLTQNVGAALIVSALLATLGGCENKGPGQKAGKAVDNAADRAGQQIEKAGDSIQDTARGNK